jgi:hypothetical protein
MSWEQPAIKLMGLEVVAQLLLWSSARGGGKWNFHSGFGDGKRKYSGRFKKSAKFVEIHQILVDLVVTDF